MIILSGVILAVAVCNIIVSRNAYGRACYSATEIPAGKTTLLQGTGPTFSEPNGLKKSKEKLLSLRRNITVVLEGACLDNNNRPDKMNISINSIADAVNIYD